MKRRSIFEVIWPLKLIPLAFSPSQEAQSNEFEYLSCSRLSHLDESDELNYYRTLFVIFSGQRELKWICTCSGSECSQHTTPESANNNCACLNSSENRRKTNFPPHHISYQRLRGCVNLLLFVDRVPRFCLIFSRLFPLSFPKPGGKSSEPRLFRFWVCAATTTHRSSAYAAHRVRLLMCTPVWQMLLILSASKLEAREELNRFGKRRWSIWHWSFS